MKIICKRCKKIIGEQAPYQDNSEIKAKCTDCIAKDKEAISRFTPKPALHDGQEVTLDSGLKGRLWVAKGKSEQLSLWELAVAGRRFVCGNRIRGTFEKHLDKLKDQEVEVSFLHSMSCKLPDSKRKKNNDKSQEAENKFTDSTQYNCTIKVPKQYALSMFDGMADRLNKILEILSRAGARSFDEFRDMAMNRQKEAVK